MRNEVGVQAEAVDKTSRIDRRATVVRYRLLTSLGSFQPVAVREHYERRYSLLKVVGKV